MKNVITIFLAFVSVGIFAQDSPGVYTIQNAKINTSYADFGTAFLGDNKVVFASPKEGFTLNREENNGQPFLDLYMGEVTDDGQLIRKQKMPGDINSKYHEGMVSFTKDMKTIYFSANGKIKKVKRKDRKGSITKNTITLQLFKSTIDENGEWGHLELLPFNSDDFSTGHPVLNRDDSKLYFVSDRPESLGKTDIFVVDIYEDGTYGQPVNLGPQINTTEREMFPFIGKDNVLYFSSDGYPGYGELDVYASKIFDNTVSTPINLEEPVNSEKDDFAYIIDDHKHKGYFSSNREGGRGDDDIYTFTASPPIYIECQQEISGVVKNVDTQELIPNVQIMLFDEKGKKLQTFLSNENDASFSFEQACNTTYTLKGYLEGYLIGEMDIKTVNDLKAKPIEIVMQMSVDPTHEIDVIADASEINNEEGEQKVKNQDLDVEEEAANNEAVLSSNSAIKSADGVTPEGVHQTGGAEVARAAATIDEKAVDSQIAGAESKSSSNDVVKAVATGTGAVLAQRTDEQESVKSKDQLSQEAANNEAVLSSNIAEQEIGVSSNDTKKSAGNITPEGVQHTGRAEAANAGITIEETAVDSQVARAENKSLSDSAVKAVTAGTGDILAQSSDEQESAKSKDQLSQEAANNEAVLSSKSAEQQNEISSNSRKKSADAATPEGVQRTGGAEVAKAGATIDDKAVDAQVAGKENKSLSNSAVKAVAAGTGAVLAQDSDAQENAKNDQNYTIEAANKEAGTSANVAVQETGTSSNFTEKLSTDEPSDKVQQTTAQEQAKNQAEVAEEDGTNEDTMVSSVSENNTSSGIPEKSAAGAGEDMAYSDDQDPGSADKKNVININSIYFDFDKHNIRYDARLEMDKLVKVLQDYPQMKIEVNSHTDIRGTEKYNDTLSIKRADETVQYLIDKGIEAERITSKGYGEKKLAQKCSVKPCTAFEHQLNRRSEFLIFNNGVEDVIVKSGNRLNEMDENKDYYTSNSGLFMNYNFFEDDEVYTVQIGAFQGNVQNNKYSKLTNLFHHRYDDGFSRYFAGIFETSSEARKHMRQMRKNGFADAFVVGLKGEQRF